MVTRIRLIIIEGGIGKWQEMVENRSFDVRQEKLAYGQEPI